MNPLQHVLIVDDIETNRYLLRALLEGYGYVVAQADHGAAALALAREAPPDLIVSDILMPVMDGFALCREWQSDEQLRYIPFVFYTATYTEEADRRFALALGADAFIIKPQEPSAFITMIREVVDRVRAEREARPGPVGDAEDAQEPSHDEATFLREHNEALIRRLESKMEQLQRANRALQDDIARRRAAEESLRESEERFRSLVDAAPEGIFVVSEGRFVFVNPAFVGLVGASAAEDLIGQVATDYLAPEFRAAGAETLARLTLDSGPSPLAERDLLGVDGERVPVETTVVAIRYAGRLSQLVFVRDISDRRRHEDERAKLEAQLRQAQKMESVGRLAGGVAHDFNNMLTVILGHAQMALVQAALQGQDLVEHLQQVVDAAHRSADLTRQLLIFARKGAYVPEVLNLNEAVGGTLAILQRLIGEDIDLRWAPGDHLWPVKVDRTLANQVLANLCVNARDAIEGVGKVTIETANVVLDEAYCAVHVECTPGEYVMLAVSDTGCGMDADTQERLFEPFFTTKPAGQGTGLGLSIVYGVVRQSGGAISVYSEVGSGTTFRIYLPRCSEAASAGQAAVSAQASRGGEEVILLVEDEKAILALARAILDQRGYRVLPAGSPSEALRLAEEHQGAIDLLVTDVVMPEMSGRELADRITATNPGIKRLYASGYTANVVAHRGVTGEGDAFLQKPYSPTALTSKVREVLDGG